jgi:hypothetical protein
MSNLYEAVHTKEYWDAFSEEIASQPDKYAIP